MGVFADLVVADPNLFEQSEFNYENDSNWKNVNGLTLNMMVSLYCIMSKKRFSKALYKQFPQVRSITDKSTIHQIPDALKLAAAKLESDAIKSTAKLWFDDEQDFSALRIPLEVAERNLANFCALSREHQEANSSIFLVSK